MTELQAASAEPALNWIGGEWARRGELRASTSPSTGETLGTYVDCDVDDARRAIASAREAFENTAWARDNGLRSRALNQLADLLEQRSDALSLMLSREGGKLHAQTQWEVHGAVDWLRYAAASALLQAAGRAMETAPGVHFRSETVPIGVVGVISPWNSPIILSVRAIGPALAAGCAVVLKLPAQTALTNGLFNQLVAEATMLPKGILNVFTESGNDGASLLVSSRDVNAISFTGSTEVGRLIAANGGKTLKRVNLELGGKTPLVVFDDADLGTVVPQIVIALLAMNGQFCCTGSRVLVQRGIADRLRQALIEAYENVRVGPAEDPQAQLGPLIDKASVARIDDLVAGAASYAKILVRGGPVGDGPLATGAFYRLSLIEVEPLDALIVQHELFGPVQTFEIFEDDADAVHRANATEYGLAASVFSGDVARAERVGKAIEAGHIWLNCWGVLSGQFEHCGFKQSGVGLLAGPRSIEEFQEVKVFASTTVASKAA